MNCRAQLVGKDFNAKVISWYIKEFIRILNRTHARLVVEILKRNNHYWITQIDI